MRPSITARPRALVLAIAAVATAGLAAAAPSAGAQEDPYGGTTTTTAAGASVGCELHASSGTVGSSASVTVRDVKPGAHVRVLFDGEEVAEATADAESNGPADLDIAFEVPSRAPGSYEVFAVGPSFSARCATAAGVAAYEVVRGVAGGGGGSSGFLPRTGVELVALIALACTVIAVGLQLRATARRRRGAAHVSAAR
jgi:hypothetical protein